MTHIIFLKTKTWVGSFCMTAEHYYGYIMGIDRKSNDDYPTIKVTHEISQDEANRLNESESDLLGHSHRPGDECTQFFSEEEVVEKAVKIVQEKCVGTSYILLKGEEVPNNFSPLECVCASPDMGGVRAEINKLYAIWEKNWHNDTGKEADGQYAKLTRHLFSNGNHPMFNE